ncbi:MAG: M56 family metallopeptidase [Prosthecobacter sp.]
MSADSSLIELLGHAALKGAAVLGIALLLGLLLRRAAAARRYAVWITAVMMLGILPLALLVLPAWRVLPHSQAGTTLPVEQPMAEVAMADVPLPAPLADPASTQEEASPPAALPAVVVSARAAPPTFHLTWDVLIAWLPAVWLAITGLILLRLVWSAWCLHRLEKTLAPGTVDLLGEVACEIGLRHAPRLFIGAENAVPMVWGVWRPRLLLPRGFEAWSPEKLRGVLLHELAHLKRRDPLALWAAQWVKALHWFNPLAWLTLRQLRADQERACDDTVLRHGMRPSDYAQHLLDLSRHARLAPGLALCALTITRCAPVEARVKAILDPRRSREGLTARWLLGLSGFALLTTLPVAMLHGIEGPKPRGRILDRNGIVLAESTPEKPRHYPLKTLASQVLGLMKFTNNKVPQPEGWSGIEKQQDGTLRAGKDISLTLDVRVQALAARAMTDAGHSRGAVVVLDPRTGAILALVSRPSVDRNRYSPVFNQLEWAVYDRDENRPLWDRCVNMLVPPSGAYTPLTALVAISAGVADKTFDCRPATTSHTSKFECLKIRAGGTGHGVIGLEGGLQHSCRHYWCQAGMAAGLGAFGKIGQKIGFGESYGVLEVESPGTLPVVDKTGTLPTQEWWEKRRKGNAAWSETDTASLAEGFGYARVSVLQMAVLAATVANTGHVPQPALIHGGAPAWRADLVKEGLPKAQIQRVREGMRLAVNSDDGAGRSARSEKAQIAGSVGVLKMDGEQQEWFVGFAPYDTPRLAFAIYSETGNHGRAGAASVAKRLVEDVLALPEDGSGEVLPMEDKADRAEIRRKLEELTVRADEIARAVTRAQKATGADLVIKSRVIDEKKLSVQGEAANLSQALQFRDKLMAEVGTSYGGWGWKSPVPQPAAGGVGRSVRFHILGAAQTSASASGVNAATKGAAGQSQTSWKMLKELGELRFKIKVLEKEQPLNEAVINELKKSEQDLAARWHASQVPPKAVPANRMSSGNIKNWKAVQKEGVLADLPKEAIAHVAKAEPVETRVSPDIVRFWFSVPREEAQRWLMASLSEKAEVLQSKMLSWPDGQEPFYRIYFMAGHCTIHLHSLDGKTVCVQITKHKRPVLIAPDEATPPRPKTAAPRELDGVVSAETAASLEALRLTGSDPALEQLFIEARLLPPTLLIPEHIPSRARQGNPFIKRQKIEIPMREVIVPTRLSRHLPSEGKRFQQSLLVTLPEGP